MSKQYMIDVIQQIKDKFDNGEMDKHEFLWKLQEILDIAKSDNDEN